MGIFEKSIPKYIVNPISQDVQIAPQDVYVDDLFDPLFNTNVRRAMEAKYGGGLYGVTGGYSELLKNTWGGEGPLGKGMGLLSTFGRTMEKADDLVLGLTTETVEGFTGQGFDDPFVNIFANDQDYSGKRLLASVANIGRKLAGTTVTEDDLGTAWNLPGLGIDLATDVGILGGSVARKLAPAAKDLTSKELFKNLGKSGLKTTVGEVGQLMSNYDDLMTKVAIDATAPGLRPAFKALKNKLADYVATHSYKDYVDVEMEPIVQAIRNIDDIEKSIPKVPDAAARPFADRIQEAEKSSSYNRIKHHYRIKKKDLLKPSTPTVDVDILRKNIADTDRKIEEETLTGLDELIKNVEGYGKISGKRFDISTVGRDEVSTNIEKLTLSDVRDLLNPQFIGSLNPTYADDVLNILDSDYAISEALTSGHWSSNEATNNAVLRVLGDTGTKHTATRSGNSKFTVSPSRLYRIERYGNEGATLSHALLDKARGGASKHAIFNTPKELDDFLESDEFLLAFSEHFKIPSKYTKQLPLTDPKFQDILKSLQNAKSPLRLGASATDSLKNIVSKTDLEDLAVRIYNSELAKTPKHLRTGSFISEYSSKNYYTSMYKKLDELKKLLKDAYYPNSASVKDYTAAVENLSKFFDDFKTTYPYTPDVDAVYNTDADEFIEELYKALDDIDQSYLQKLRGEPHHLKEVPLEDVTFEGDLNATDYVRTILHQIADGIDDSGTLSSILTPVSDLVQVIPKAGALAPSKTTADTVRVFNNNILPQVVAYSAKYNGANPLGKFPGALPGQKASEAWNDYYRVRALLGYVSKDKFRTYTVHPNGYANRLMYQSFLSTGYDNITDAAIRAELSQRKFTDASISFKDEILESVKRYEEMSNQTKKTAEHVRRVKEAIVEQRSSKVATDAYETPSIAQSVADDVIEKAFPEMQSAFDKGMPDDTAKAVFGTKRWSLFKQIQEARAVPRKNSVAKDRATLRTDVARDLGKAFTSVTGKRPPRDFKAFYNIRQKMIGDSIKGSDFWTVFRRSGMLAAAYEEGSPMLKTLKASLESNAALVNSNAGKDIVEVVEQKLSNGNIAVIMRWNGNKKTAKLVKDAQKKLDSAKFVDTVFTNPEKLTQQEQEFMASDDMVELSRLMEQLQAQASDQAKYLGFNFDNASPYTKHAMRHDPKTAEYLNSTFYTNVSSDDYDTISRIISDLDGYRQMDKGTFGTFLQERRFRGDYWNLESEAHPMFEYSPDKVFNSTLGDGIFANLQYQSFVDLFVNDNFKIKEWFKTPDDLKKVLYAKDSKGALSGNLQNLELVTFKTDANGRVIGLTKFDKMSDAGLEKALQDENTILVPANAVSHMDNLLRKDVRFGNKFWTFINKHFTIPFKFSLLSNPGFILGNMGDATFKLATTMSEKYGTPVAAEVQNVTESINTVVSLKNSYYKAFDNWIKTVDDKGIQLSPEARVPEIVAMSPKYKESFLKYLDNSFKIESVNPITKAPESEMVFNNLLQEDIDGARVYMLLQDMQMSSSKLREFADFADLEHTSNFEVPYSLWDRIAQGSGKYSASKPSTWGLFMNNPVMKGFSDASGAWEDLIRSASIVNDLKHKRYRIEDLSEFSKIIVNDPIEYRRLTEVDLENAKNTMFNAQFDYERVNDFLDSVGKVMPFPIFFLKNFQYWMDLFMRNPQFVDNVIDVQEGLWSGYDSDDKFMKDAKGRGAVPVGGESLPEWFKGVYKPSPMQSMFGAFNLLGDPINNLTYRVNPLIGGAAAVASSALPDNELTTLLNNPENVKYRPYSTNMYERNVKIGDEKFNPMEYAVHRANPFERATNTYLRTPAKIKEEEFQLSDALPSVFQPMF